MPGVHVGDVLLQDRTARAIGVCFAPHERSTGLVGGIALALDTLTPLHGSKVPEIGKTGWIVRPLAPGVSSEEIRLLLPGAHEHSPVPYDALLKAVGKDAVKGFTTADESSGAEAA